MTGTQRGSSGEPECRWDRHRHQITESGSASFNQAQPPDGGFILVTVLWALALIGLLAVVLTTAARLEMKARANLVQHAEAAMLADGFVRLLALQLAGHRLFSPLRASIKVDGTVVVCRVDNEHIQFRIIDAAGLIDLNAAPPLILQLLLKGVGLRNDEAQSLAAAIYDFRDADDVASPQGAESDAYRTAGLAHGPKNAPFEAVGELDQVLGMTPALYARLRPLVTIHSRMAGIDPVVAPAELLDMLDVSEESAPGAAAGAHNAPRRGDGSRLPVGAVAKSHARTFAVRVRVTASRSATFERWSVIEIDTQSATGFAVREWSTGQSGQAMAAAETAAGHSRCFGDVF